jgi:hypothetical protein
MQRLLWAGFVAIPPAASRPSGIACGGKRVSEKKPFSATSRRDLLPQAPFKISLACLTH